MTSMFNRCENHCGRTKHPGSDWCLLCIAQLAEQWHQEDKKRRAREAAWLVKCGCMACNQDEIGMRMFVCCSCGFKRCPKATWHCNECSGSNEPNQPGSSYREPAAPRCAVCWKPPCSSDWPYCHDHEKTYHEEWTFCDRGFDTEGTCVGWAAKGVFPECCAAHGGVGYVPHTAETPSLNPLSSKISAPPSETQRTLASRLIALHEEEPASREEVEARLKQWASQLADDSVKAGEAEGDGAPTFLKGEP